MKVLLVNPARPARDSYVMPPLHLLYIAQAIRRTGHEAEIIDLPYLISTQPDRFKYENDSGIDAVLTKEFDVLGIGSVVSAYIYCERLVKRVKAQRKNVPIIVGGSVGLPVKDLWAKHAPVDYICESDGERVIERFMQSYPHDLKAARKIPGLHYLNEQGKYVGNKPQLPMNLDYIPFLTYDEIDLDYFMKSLRKIAHEILGHDRYQFKKDEHFLPMMFSRGCVYQCTFCFHFNHLHRKHSAKYIADYMEFMKERYDVSAFYMIDDLAIIDRKWLHGVLDEIIRRNLGIRFFSSGGKPDVVDKEILVKMKQAGCRRLSFGVESGSQTILDVMNKRTTVADNVKAISLMREVGIPNSTNIVFGMPKETIQTMNETAKFLMDLDLNTNIYYASRAVPYPGSPLFDYCLQKGLIKNTREYLDNIGGYGDYRINLTDMSRTRFLAKVLQVGYQVDMAYYRKRKQYQKVWKLFFMQYAHVLYFVLLPANLRMKFKLKQGLKCFFDYLLFEKTAKAGLS